MPFNLREGAAGVGRAGWERQSCAGPPPAPAVTACHHGPPLNPHPSPTDPAAPTATCAGHFRFRCLFYSRPERDTRQQRTWRLAQLAGQLGPSVPPGRGGRCRVPLVFTFLIMFSHFPQQAGTVFKQQRPPGGFAGRAASTRPSCDQWGREDHLPHQLGPGLACNVPEPEGGDMGGQVASREDRRFHVQPKLRMVCAMAE